MAYGQKNYSEHVGNGPYPISATGCLLVSFCNLLERFGEGVDPVSLNNWFNAHHGYLSSPEDGAGTKDDLGYGSISSYAPNIHVTSVGGAGWPPTNNAIVKFRYRSKSHPTLANGKPNMITHFCLVADHAAKSIIDSYDGLVKTPAHYKSYYGMPIGYATYTKASPAKVLPISSPAPATPHPAPSIPGVVNLVQKVKVVTPVLVVRTGPGTKYPGGQANSTDGHLHQGTVVEITGYVKGESIDGNPWWLRSTRNHYFWSGGTDFKLPQEHSKPVAAPAPAPKPPVAPAPSKPSNIVYTKLEKPIELVTNKQPTHAWALNFKDDAHAVPVAQLDKGVPITAYGRAQRTDLDKPAYFMTQEDFGKADVTGIPAHNNGINTVDLSPKPTPKAEPAAPASEPTSPAEGSDVSAESPAAPNTDDQGEKVPVTVGSWQKSYTAFLGPQEYVANKTIDIHNIDEENPVDPPTVELTKGQTVNVAGTFSRDGVKYYRTVNSVNAGKWYGIPTTVLVKLDGKSEDELDKIMEEIAKEEQSLNAHEQTVAKAAASTGFIQWVLHFFRNNKKG